MTLGRKITFAFIGVGSAISLIGFWGAIRFSTSLEILHHQHPNEMEEIRQIEALHDQMIHEAQACLASQNQQPKQQFMLHARELNKRLSNLKAFSDGSLSHYTNHQSGHLKNLLERFRVECVSFVDESQELFRLTADGQDISSERLVGYQQRAESQLLRIEEIFSYASRRHLMEHNAARSQLHNARWTLYVFSLLAVVICAWVGYLLARAIARPAADLMKAVEKITQGNLDVRARVYNSDEIGILARAFNQMADRVQENYQNEQEGRLSAEYLARQKQADLEHIARLGVMGQLASVLAHELNQPLCAMVTSAQACERMVKNAVGDSQDLLNGIQQIHQQGQRAGKIISHLRYFLSKKDKSPRTVEVLSDVIKDILELSQPLLRKNRVRLQVDLSDGVGKVRIDRLQIEQVILNLVHNAVEALSATSSNRVLKVQVESVDQDRIEVKVVDTGCGVEIDDLESIFKSFFTTKSTGMGIGLSLSRSIIEAHGGRLWATKNPDCGLTLHFTLPLEQPEAVHVV